jgi:hypothetical protein
MQTGAIWRSWNQVTTGWTRCVNCCVTLPRDDRLVEPGSGADFRREMRRLRALLRDEPSR